MALAKEDAQPTRMRNGCHFFLCYRADLVSRQAHSVEVSEAVLPSNNTIQQRFIYALSKNSIHKIKKCLSIRQRRWRVDVSLQSRATTLRVPSQEQDEEETSRKGTLGFLFKLAMRQDMRCK